MTKGVIERPPTSPYLSCLETGDWVQLFDGEMLFWVTIERIAEDGGFTAILAESEIRVSFRSENVLDIAYSNRKSLKRMFSKIQSIFRQKDH
jgi:uncharacterized protein YraI